MRPNPQETANFVTFTEEILNRKLHLWKVDKPSCKDNIEYNILYIILETLVKRTVLP